jgi:thiol-disulfide isomerase/thioredoxin
MTFRMAPLVACLAAGMMCACAGQRISAADRALAAWDLHGGMHQPLGHRAAPATVLIFIAVECPISNSFAPEINRLVEEYGSRGVVFYLAHADKTLDLSEAQTHARQFGLACPVLLDPGHELVRAVGATITPEAAVISPRGDLLYRGRIDDRYVDFGIKRFEPSQRDLREALDDILAGRSVRRPRAPAVGCFISGT